MSSDKKLTVIVVVFNMRREAPRTLFALTPRYQLGVYHDKYEVRVIDNGSSEPLEPSQVAALGRNFSYSRIDTDCPSPCRALNKAVKQARTPYVAIMIDGARIPSPGILAGMLEGISLCGDPFIYTLGMHLGSQIQNQAMQKGYNQTVEDRLLGTVPWQADGYRLFDISVPGGFCQNGFIGPINESNMLCIRRDSFLELGGFDEGFASAGGGLANLDFFNRAHHRNGMTPILLLGEATFHQFHGGGATNAPASQSQWSQMSAEYEALRGKPYHNSWRSPLFLGRTRPGSAHLFPPIQMPKQNNSLLIVLGMHRSGTSCLAGMLQACGFSTGAMSGWTPNNQWGNREDLAVVKLNDAILSVNNAAWDNLPRESLLLVDERHRLARAKILDNIASSNKPWMFKDPRTLLTLSFWREVLPNPSRIGIFRHPWRVAMSLYFRAEEQQPINQGLTLWIGYNKALLAEYARAPYPLVCFDLPREAFIEQVAEALRQECPHLEEEQNLDFAKLGAFYDARQVHQQNSPEQEWAELSVAERNLLQEAEEIYRQLCALAKVEGLDFLATATRRSGTLARLREADQAARDGEEERALGLYRDMLATANDPALIWRRMIKLRQGKKDVAQVMQLCQAAVESCPDDPGLWVQLADTFQQQSQLEAALGAIDAAIKLRPDWGLPYLRRGIFLNALGRWQESISVLHKGLVLNPNSTWHFVPYSIALLRTGKQREAEENFQIALARNPTSAQPVIHHQWAQALAAIGELEKALEHHNLMFSGENIQPYMVLAFAKLLKNMGRLSEAELLLRQAMEKGIEVG